MGAVKSFKKRWNWLVNVEFDKATGFYRYQRYNQWIYIRHPRHFLDEAEGRWLCENILFHHYIPKNNDVVIDLGAGYGEEAVWLSQKAPQVKYFGMETQPIIFECLANTYYDLGPTFQAFPYALTDSDEFKIQSQFSYASSSEQKQGYIRVPTLRWDDFCRKNGIDQVDLVKMNIEGAEKDFVLSVKDFSKIKRWIISCHDFRANHGEGEHFRTKAIVSSHLQKNGYKIKSFSHGKGWSDDWIFAEHS